ncbi:MAG: TIGR03560 family F420-dependent LLM class oxidoreductase [Acidimicrobiia bacterium]
MDDTERRRLPEPCLVVLVGPSGAGKSTWAQATFGDATVVSSDRLRALVGTGEDDQRASKDAFAVLDLVVDRRLRRRLTTVVDSTALEPERRRAYLALARRHRVPCVAVLFDTPEAVCRGRNRARRGTGRAVPAAVITAQLGAFRAAQAQVPSEGFDTVLEPPPATIEVVPRTFLDTPAAVRRHREEPVPLTFGLHIASYTWPGGPATTAVRLADIAVEAEAAGFESVWVMDHVVQIPVVGREWEDMLEPYTTLGFLAGRTSTVRLGTMVTGITYRNLALLGKTIATLDVLSGGRAMAGLGIAWHEREHRLYGWDFPAVGRRYDMLEDALQLLPLLWGPGAPAFEGRTTRVPEAICYPRPLQSRVPLLVGGSGERRTLPLVARYADACNLFGDPATVAHKVGVLRAHCAEVDRDPDEVTVTQLSAAMVTEPGQDRPRPDAGTVEEQVGRYRELAEAGVQSAIVSLPGLADGALERFAPVVAAFR